MVPIVSIVGVSGSGKTTLIEKVIKLLTQRGFSVGVVKHDAHGFEIDHEGKDSWRHKKAGAGTVALSSGEKFAVIKDVATEWHPRRIISSYLTDMDVVLMEGYKKLDNPRIEVLREAVSKNPATEENEKLLAFATDFPLKSAKPVYDLNDAGGITDLIEEKIIKPHSKATVSLTVDGRDVALKPFLEDMMRESVLGMVRSLKGCSDPKEIELKVRKK
jgi:molybdopterin-guanine dinucleotide biosynthesis protein B